ncbi:MAG: flagellar export chaperone FliS [Lachnospiraceae bacterium]|jgi:flagellar protein FliS|uniref:flagellar export chaperone FliS n=1 Tax=Candidatus Merdisoma sp. JLR.KK006 TaxID=3112626 RepID=UPI002FF0660B|nr:flagellar export chaperone FliS [Lachnospiraceae bacterium]
MNANGYQQYKTQSVNTMTASEMLLLLFDELVKRLTRAELALEVEDAELFEQSVNRSREIVQYLKTTLDRQYPISRELSIMYDFFIYELSRISAGRNPKVIQELKELVEELREAFREASRMLNN